MRRYLDWRYHFHGWQRNSVGNRGDLAGYPSHRVFRRRTTTNSRRPIDSSCRQKYWSGVSRVIGPRQPISFARLSDERPTSVVFRFDFSPSSLFRSSLLFFPPLFSMCSWFVPRFVFTYTSVVLYIDIRRRLNLIFEPAARIREISRHYESSHRQRNGNFDVASIATWINCFLATDHSDRSINFIGQISMQASFSSPAVQSTRWDSVGDAVRPMSLSFLFRLFCLEYA